jgi:hemolysin activation/secretion protein
LRQPVFFGKSSQIDLLAGAKTRRVDNWISDVFLNKTETVDGSLGAEFQRADASGTWIGSYSYTYGQVQTGNDEDYGYGRGWLRRQQQLAKEWSLIGSASFQHSKKPLLPASEQFVIGGEGTVRGYPVASYSGDSGYTLSVELHHPIGKTNIGNNTQLAASGFFFIDYGYTRPYRPPSSTLRSYEQLTSGGWGINATLGKYLSARLTLAYAPDTLQDPMSSRLSTLFQIVGTFY